MILVSEVMLQQTQVHRVIPKYEAFIKRFPTASSLAKARLPDVLSLWSGLGYNRRAKMLHDAAKVIAAKGDTLRQGVTLGELVELPGVGEYTAKAVLVFAYNEPQTLIETNVRAVFLHHLFPRSKSVSDKKLLPYIEALVPKKNPREWYAALMDYGSHLKAVLPNPSRRSKHHAKQKAFKGSDREVRGAVLKAFVEKRSFKDLPFEQVRVQKAVTALKREGLISYRQ